jgi:hypothetical protein
MITFRIERLPDCFRLIVISEDEVTTDIFESDLRSVLNEQLIVLKRENFTKEKFRIRKG